MSANRYDQTPYNIYGTSNPAGEIGIEIEVEGTQLPGFFRDRNDDIAHPMSEFWRVTEDGSLRRINPGDMACEYVLRRPIDRDELPKALTYFKTKWDDSGATTYNSYRTSVHIHLNVAAWSMRKIYSFLTTYLIFEDILTEWADGGTGHRVGNRFCLRCSDAENIVTELQRQARGGFRGQLDDRSLKYGAVNIAALGRYGSLEFRALRGTIDTTVIETWTKLLLRVKDFSEKFDYPNEIISEFSSAGAESFTRAVFGDMCGEIFKNSNYDRMMYNGMRLAQDVAYSEQWQEPVAVEIPKPKKARTRITAPDTWAEIPVGRAEIPVGWGTLNPAHAQAQVQIETVRNTIARANNLNYGRPL